MRKLLSLLSLLFVFCLGFSALSAFAEGESTEEIYVTGADILRGARSNVNRELMSVNPEPDGVAFRAVFETEKPIAKFAVKREVLFTENFAVETEILQADPDCTVDIGFLYGDIDEAWLDPWDFYGVDMSDAGSLFKFKNIGGFTVRFSMSGAYTPTVMMKGIGEDLNRAAFAVAGVTESLSFLSERDLTLVKEGNDWSIRSGGARLTVEENATLLNPSGSTSAQSFLNAVLDDFLNENVYVFIAMEGHDGARAQLKVKGAGGKIFAAPFGEDPLVGNADYQKDPDREIEFSLIENYLCGMPEYADRTFTYLSQPYQNPSYLCTEKGVYLSGRDKLYGINADLSYLAPFSVFDGFSAVLGAGNMPKTTSAVNSNISLTLSGQKFASYYAWNSVYIKITFPYETIAEGFFANVLLWDKPVYNNGALSPALLAEMPVSYIPAVEGDDIVVKIAKAKGNYYVYVNGVRFGDGFETQMKQTVGAIEEGYTDNSGTQRGFYVSTLNNTSYLADGTGVDDGVLNGVAGHYLKQIGGARIVNKEPTLKAAQSPYAPEKSDITANSLKLSFSSELPERTDGNFTVDGYLVERYVNGEADGSFILKGIENRTFTDGNLRSDTRYIYLVYAVQGSDSDSPVKLVAYKPIAVKTSAVNSPNAVGGTLAFILTAGFGLSGLIACGIFCRRLRRRKARGQSKTRGDCAPPRARVACKRAMARPIALILCFCMLFGVLGGCGKSEASPANPQSAAENYPDTFTNITTPVWKSGLMYNETVLMLQSGDDAPSGKLAFKPKKIISVRNYSLNVTYRENVDYTVDGQGYIALTENSSCPFLKRENLVYATRPQGVEGLYEFPSSSSATPDLMYTETSYLVEKQLCVTYEYDKSDFSKEVVSVANEEKLPALRALLSKRARIRMAVLGDSISEGANSSGKLNIAPFQPTYSSLLRQYMEKTFGSDIVFENFSLGGMASEWGASRAYGVGQFMPDIVVLSFGANDGGTGKDNGVTPVSVRQFTANIRAAMENVRKYNPNCEFILVSSLMPNPESAAFGIQKQYAEAMKNIAADNSAVAVDMYRLHEYFINDCGKHYADMSSNYINHPNDFLIRLYTMNIISALWN